MRLLLIRHADPDYPHNTITPAGHAEAGALARRLAGAGLTRIYSSPMGRARDTARYTCDTTGLPAQILPWTAELAVEPIEDVDGTPTAAWNIAGEVVRAGGPDVTAADWQSLPALGGFDHAARQREIATASDAFLAEHGFVRDQGIYKVTRPNEERIAIFCHAGFGVSWIAHLLQLPVPLAWCGFFLAPSSVTTVLMEVRTPAVAVPRLLCAGDTSHLYAEGLQENPRGLVANAG